MMKRSFCLSVLAAALCAGLLFGCSGSSVAASQAETAASSVSSAVSSGAASSSASSSSAAANAADDEEIESVFDALSEANPISNPFEITAMNMEYDFLLEAEDVVSYKGVKSNDNGDAGLVLVIQAASGSAKTVTQALETYKSDQTAFYGNYAEFATAQANVKNAVISGRDDLVVMVIASNEADGDLAAAVEDALE